MVIPTRNSAKFIENTLKKVREELEKIGLSYEIILAEDGSEDETPEVCGKLAKKYKNVIHIHHKEKLGRGRALNIAFKKARGEILVYMDDDLATDLKHLKELIYAVKDRGYDLATGSRMMKGSIVIGRSASRKISSMVYNFLVRFLLGSKVKDHQCGFKSFRRGNIISWLDDVKDTHWFWDTEILVKAQRRGLKVYEFPVIWRESSRPSNVKLLNDIKDMGSKLINLRLSLKINDA